MPIKPVAKSTTTLLEMNERIDHASMLAYCDTQNPGHEGLKKRYRLDIYFNQLDKKVLDEIPVRLISLAEQTGDRIQAEVDIFRGEFCPLMLDWFERLVSLTNIQKPYIKTSKDPKRSGGAEFPANMAQDAITKLSNRIEDSIRLYREQLDEVYHVVGGQSCYEWLQEQKTKLKLALNF